MFQESPSGKYPNYYQQAEKKFLNEIFFSNGSQILR